MGSPRRQPSVPNVVFHTKQEAAMQNDARYPAVTEGGGRVGVWPALDATRRASVVMRAAINHNA